MTTLYTKAGRRYRVWGHAENFYSHRMRAGQFALVHCPEDGSRRYRYDVTPDTAAFLAASAVAMNAMVEAMRKRAVATPGHPVLYSKKQLAIIERFRAEMSAAGGLLPDCWLHASAEQIAQAGVDAVRATAAA